MAALERRLVGCLAAANRQYQLQDLACAKCKQVRWGGCWACCGCCGG
jgi:hypothetical protein